MFGVCVERSQLTFVARIKVRDGRTGYKEMGDREDDGWEGFIRKDLVDLDESGWPSSFTCTRSIGPSLSH